MRRHLAFFFLLLLVGGCATREPDMQDIDDLMAGYSGTPLAKKLASTTT